MSYPTEVLADSPVIYYRFGETSGTAGADSSGNGRHGTYSGVTLNQAGAIVDSDPAASFDGSSAFFDTEENATVTPGTGNFSIEFWVKTTQAPGVAGVIAGKIASGGTGNNYWVGVWSTGKAAFSITNADNSIVHVGGVTINDGNWHHVVAVKDGAVVRLYVDGAADGTTPFVGTNAVSPSDRLQFGRFGEYGASPLYFSGTLDEPAYYASALSSGRVAAHYAAGIGAATPEMSISPTEVSPRSTGVVLTLTGTSTAWDGTTVFNVSGAGATKTAQNVISGTSATVTISTSTASGTITVTETVTGSTSDTVEVLTYKKILVTDGGVDIMILEPAAYDSTLAAQLVYYHHGAGEDRDALLEDSLKATCLTQFLSDGFILCGISAGENWGNDAALAKYVSALAYLNTNYKLHGHVIWSQSMGGLAGLLNLSERAYSDCRGWLGTYPVCNLDDMHGGSFASAINSAYGGDYATNAVGHDPVLKPAANFNNRLMRFYASNGETVVTKPENSDQMHTLVSAVAQESAVIECTGDHGDPSHFQPSDYSDFVKRAMRAPAVMSGMV